MVKKRVTKLLEHSFARCWYCGDETQHLLRDTDNSEIWVCISCLGSQAHIRRFKPKTIYSLTYQKSLKKIRNLRIKKRKEGVSGGGMDHE